MNVSANPLFATWLRDVPATYFLAGPPLDLGSPALDSGRPAQILVGRYRSSVNDFSTGFNFSSYRRHARLAYPSSQHTGNAQSFHGLIVPKPLAGIAYHVAGNFSRWSFRSVASLASHRRKATYRTPPATTTTRAPGAWALGEGLILSGGVRILDSDYATSDNTAVVQNSPPQITTRMLLPDVSYQNMVCAPPTLPK